MQWTLYWSPADTGEKIYWWKFLYTYYTHQWLIFLQIRLLNKHYKDNYCKLHYQIQWKINTAWQVNRDWNLGNLILIGNYEYILKQIHQKHIQLKWKIKVKKCIKELSNTIFVCISANIYADTNISDNPVSANTCQSGCRLYPQWLQVSLLIICYLYILFYKTKNKGVGLLSWFFGATDNLNRTREN